jgi:hypothetical protein
VILLFQGDGADRLGGAHFSADMAILFAGRVAGLQLGGPEPGETSFPETGLERIGDAGFQALPAADAGLQKFVLRQGRGADLPSFPAKGKGAFDKKAKSVRR